MSTTHTLCHHLSNLISSRSSEYLIDTVVETVDYALGRPSHSGRGRSLSRHSEGSAFATCVRNVLERAEVEIPVVLAALAYLDRAKPHLHIALEEWANERVFLGALIVASKVRHISHLSIRSCFLLSSRVISTLTTPP